LVRVSVPAAAVSRSPFEGAAVRLRARARLWILALRTRRVAGWLIATLALPIISIISRITRLAIIYYR